MTTKFYESVFGFRLLTMVASHGYLSRHMTDREATFTLMTYESEDPPEAKLTGTGP
jgi:hypothetical protein